MIVTETRTRRGRVTSKRIVQVIFLAAPVMVTGMVTDMVTADADTLVEDTLGTGINMGMEGMMDTGIDMGMGMCSIKILQTTTFLRMISAFSSSVQLY